MNVGSTPDQVLDVDRAILAGCVDVNTNRNKQTRRPRQTRDIKAAGGEDTTTSSTLSWVSGKAMSPWPTTAQEMASKKQH